MQYGLAVKFSSFSQILLPARCKVCHIFYFLTIFLAFLSLKVFCFISSILSTDFFSNFLCFSWHGILYHNAYLFITFYVVVTACYTFYFPSIFLTFFCLKLFCFISLILTTDFFLVFSYFPWHGILYHNALLLWLLDLLVTHHYKFFLPHIIFPTMFRRNLISTTINLSSM